MKRYEPHGCYVCSGWCRESSDGEYVEHSDHLADKQQALAALQAKLDVAVDSLERINAHAKTMGPQFGYVISASNEGLAQIKGDDR